MRNITTVLLFCTALFTAPVLSGPDDGHGHSHGPVSSEVATEKAAVKLTQLIEGGKVEQSWADVKSSSIEQKKYANGFEWLITFNNEKVSDPAKKTLYMFFSLDGQYIAANYTGK